LLGSDLTNVIALPATTGSVPVLLPSENVRFEKAVEARLMVLPEVAVAERSAVMKMYPVVPELMI
jgi:hypothetical protein